jgi:hypothetical protein
MAGDTLWEGESNDLTSAATGGKVVKKRYRITAEYIYESSGLLGSREEQIPMWAVRDLDVVQSMIQKARNVGSVKVRVEPNEYTGKTAIILENIQAAKDVRDLINEHARVARDTRLRQQQNVTYTGAVPVAGMPPVAQAAPIADDPIEKLIKLGALLQSGLLTQEEFDAQKAKLLGL